ncbi:MAG: hypothetical protein ACHQRM_02805 [Bacteroidia bacterium]
MSDFDLILKSVFAEPELLTQPPVLLDIGASGEIHQEWKAIAPYAVCIAFDADDREFAFTENLHSAFRKLYVFNCIASESDQQSVEFFLTRSPFCSSLLKPDTIQLRDWKFWELFEPDRTVKLKSRSLISVLQELNLAQIDWFKTDSQGIDLRLFQNLGNEVVQKVLTADFEPGIIDAYIGEDKLWQLFQFMDKCPFWMCAMHVKGTQKISRDLMESYASRMDKLSLDISPGWAEVSYLNTMKDPLLLNKREVLLAWVFSTIRQQHGFALELIRKQDKLIPPALCLQLRNFSEQKLFSKKEQTTGARIRNKIIRMMNKAMGG